MRGKLNRSVAGLLAGAALLCVSSAPAEVILQYFNTSYQELMLKMPELAEVGYQALWLPPPTKSSSVYSTGYDCWDPFDIGGKNQRGTVRTRYGTEAELLMLIETAHRFGIRVYFDNIMNHRAFDVPGYNAGTPIDIYPGMVPEDFHMRTTEEGFYRKWDNVADWSDTWQIQNRNFSDLIDIAQEMPDNGNFGQNEGDHVPKIKLVRHPNNPEYYCYLPGAGDGVYVGYNSTNITTEILNAPENAWFYEEDVNAYLIRAVRWLVAHTKVDGLRLDAVKHVPAYFFGEQWAGDKDSSDAGYCGQAQVQYNLTRGFNDWNSHRDTVFSTEQNFGRNDLMMFGEHLGEPPPTWDYIQAGMRLVDSKLHSFLNGSLGQPWGSLDGLQWPGGKGFAASDGVPFVKSHDDDYASRPELQFALNLTRQGLPCVYTDGNYQSETLGESGGAFPRHANINFLGQWGDGRIPNLVYIHNHFARGRLRYDGGGNIIEGQLPRWGDGDVAAFERLDKRENESMSNGDAAVLFFVMNDDYSAGQYREIDTSFGVGAYLWQYSAGGGGFYYEVPWDRKIKVITPPGGYFAFSWRSPEESDLWSRSGGRPITIQENGQSVGWISYERKDGPDGDPGFNPYGVPDDDTTDFAYTYYVPRVSSPTNIRFAVRADGSAKNVLVKLDGGIDLNGGGRDHPPGNEGSTAVFEGYEQSSFVRRQYAEKFAAVDTTRNTIGSTGAETYVTTIGSNAVSVINGAGPNDYDGTYTAEWLFHDPNSTNDTGLSQFWSGGAGSTNYLWVKVGYEFDINNLCVYYTTDGETWPEGAGGEGRPNTHVAPLAYHHKDATVGAEEWWTGTIPPLASNTVLRYKIGGYKVQNGDTNAIPYVPWHIPFPGNADDVALKKSMMGTWEIAGFNPSGVSYYPHNDYSETRVGLMEGFHVVRARAFLERDNRASIYNTFVQPFYYDVQTPKGEILWPKENDWLSQNEYGCVVRTDPTVTEVWYHIDDASDLNDDGQTGQSAGNGTNALGEVSWVQASQVRSDELATVRSNEWRFSYINIPTNSPATIKVRLLELSSSTNMSLTNAVQAHWSELERHVTANGPDYSMFVKFPEHDGDLVALPYTMRVWCSKALWDGWDQEVLRQRFLIKLDGNATDRGSYGFDWNEKDGKYYELNYNLPDLWDGDPDRLHEILVTHTNAGGGGVTLTARRLFKAAETEKGPHVDIVNPLEFDSDGKPTEIVLRDIANPAPEDRQFTIRVETDLDALHCWIVFTNSTGQTVPYASTTNAIAGTVSVTSGTNAVIGNAIPLSGTVTVAGSNTTVTGTGTQFTSELSVGNRIGIISNVFTVAAISNATELTLGSLHPEPGVTNVAASLQPSFDGELSVGNRVMVGGHFLGVESIGSASNLTLTTDYPGGSSNGLTAYRIDGNPQVVGNRQYWQFLWTNMVPGRFTFWAHVNTVSADTNTISASALRNVTVILREEVDPDPDDEDDDDDGISDVDETTSVKLPDSNPESWTNRDVQAWVTFGKTHPLQPDSDGDLLPDGLESGWRRADPSMTDTNVDTNGDGFNNFLPDLDPPIYNTKPDNGPGGFNLAKYVLTESRTKQIYGSITDSQNPDSDYDGLKDGIEDANRNGWVDGDGEPLPPSWNPWRERNWPDGEMDPWETWTETDPNNGDTDGDGASDGYGEDRDLDGVLDGDANSNRVYDAGEVWLETDPLNFDTDGDGLPDGWERQYWFDPLNDGVNGHTNMGTGLAITNGPEHGADGNPDGDTIVQNGQTNDYTNILEYQNGTNPRQADTGEDPPEGTIVIGPGPVIGVVNGVTNYQEFMDWTIDDCLELDEYEGGGRNNQLGDLYLGWDGWDSSRDIVAFYARDGGDADGKVYFRVDFHDLRAHAEEENLDIYVVIDTGNTGQGEVALPDDVDTKTEMQWEAVVAVYQSSQGAVYVDTLRDEPNNTTDVGQDLYSKGVVRRDQSTADGFIDAYFNAELDAVEFSISRNALTTGNGAGWNGNAFSQLNFQVFVTKDGTQNDGSGAGDIGGRSDVRDAIKYDKIAEDYWQDQAGLKPILYEWIPGTSRAGRAKVAMLLHGNQAIQPGSVIQDKINTGQGAGYYRPLDPHGVFAQPLNLHITPTLGSAIEWAAADPAAGKPWRDGPALNARIAELAATNVVDLFASTFSDHMLPYFTHGYNRDNEQLARDFLRDLYGVSINTSSAVFWPPERLIDADVFGKILDMGYAYTVIDQNTHMFNWLDRTTSLIDDGYRINTFHGVNCFVINDIATSYIFSSTDNGAEIALRALFNRKARSGTQDQVITMFTNWEAFTENANADAYDASVRWMANRPWVHLVTLEQIAAGEVDVNKDGVGDSWYAINRGSPSLSKQAHNWLNHATKENYDNWYLGAAEEESLQNKRFDIRPGQPVPSAYGMLYTVGMLSNAWRDVSGIADTNVAQLGRAALHASTFQTAFHNENEHDLRRYSTGDYMYPASGSNTLASFAVHAQSQSRMAAQYRRVDQWAAIASSLTTTQTAAEDVDLDGEVEYLLYNRRLFALFERVGGRLVGVWLRDIWGGGIYQVMGNVVGYSGIETEYEGSSNVDTNQAVIAHRTSGLKDWWVDTSQYVNDYYGATPAAKGWTLTSSDGDLQKTITLGDDARELQVQYALSGGLSGKTLYVRNGLSPNLADLLVNGQQTLGPVVTGGGVATLSNTNYGMTVSASIVSPSVNLSAVDDWPDSPVGPIEFDTVNMRNQAQTHQLELSGTGSFGFSLSFRVSGSDWDGDGMPNTYEDGFGFLSSSNAADGALDQDGDGASNGDEYVSGTGPNNPGDFLYASSLASTSTGIVVRFPARVGREYRVNYDDALASGSGWSNATPTPITVSSDRDVEWVDDGSTTEPDPLDVTNRFYRIDVQLME